MDKITLVAALTDYEETYDVRNVDAPENLRGFLRKELADEREIFMNYVKNTRDFSHGMN